MKYFSKNINLLSEKNLVLANTLKNSPKPYEYRIELAKSNKPILIRLKDNGEKIIIHSTYDPENEAVRFINSKNLKESLNYIVTGFGLGYHLMELIRHVSSKARILVIEKQLEVLRIAFEAIDLTLILQHPGVSILLNPKKSTIIEYLEKERTELAVNGYTSIAFKSLVDLEREYYESLNVTFQQSLQEARLNIKTRCTFSRLYYQNYLENLPALAFSPGIIEMAGKYKNIPGILISAGPSLDKNIQLLQTAKNRTLLIAVATALPPLLSNGIVPDFVVAIDADNTSIRSFDLDSPIKNCKLLYDPCLPPSIVNSFHGQRISFDSNLFISEWTGRFLEPKGNFRNSLSVAHTAYLFARTLGCDPIILTGQDLAFDKNQLHCRNSYYESLFYDNSGYGTSVKELKNNHFQNYRNAIKQTVDIFGRKINTTTAMDSYRNIFSDEFQKFGHVYNASEGGSKIPGTIPITLREAINKFCSIPYGQTKPKLSKFIYRQKSINKIVKILDEKIYTFMRWRKRLKQIKNQLTQIETKKFIDQMNSFYQDFLKEEDAVRLLQEYAYQGFLDWNKANHQITIIEGKKDRSEILLLKLSRDSEFMDILLNALESLEKKFKIAKKNFSQFNHKKLK